MNHSLFAYHVQHNADQLALSYLEDLWVTRDPAEPRCYTIEFVCFFNFKNLSFDGARDPEPFCQTFKENPHFTDKVLKKEYKYIPPPAAENEKPDADGITDSMLEFSWERDIEASVSVKKCDADLATGYSEAY